MDLLLRRRMVASQTGGGGNVIYQLYDYNCDGTQETAINTGIYLFDRTQYPTGWTIEFDFTIGQNNVSNGSYLRCRTATSPYPGITVRRWGNNANSMEGQVGSGKSNVNAPAGSRQKVVVTNDLTNVQMKLNEESQAISQSTPSSVASPLVIGGELSNDTTQTWNSSRFGIIYIHSLIIRAL